MGDPSLFSPSGPNQGIVWISSASLNVGQANPVLIIPKSLAALPMLKDAGCITTRFPSNSDTCTSFLLRAANAVRGCYQNQYMSEAWEPQHNRRKELRHCPGRATRRLTAKAVICAVSEQVFEPRLADTEAHSAGLSTRASRAWQVTWRTTCHFLTICKPAAPRTHSRWSSSSAQSLETDSTCSCSLQEQTEEASQQAFQD